MGYEKDIFSSFAYEFEPSHKSRRKPCISSATCCGISSARMAVYHQAAGNARGRVMRYKGGLPPLMIYTTASWWYAKPAAWIKKSDAFASDFLAEKERFELSRRYSRPTPLAGAPLRPTWVLLRTLTGPFHTVSFLIIHKRVFCVKMFFKIKFIFIFALFIGMKLMFFL